MSIELAGGPFNAAEHDQKESVIVGPATRTRKPEADPPPWSRWVLKRIRNKSSVTGSPN